MKILDVIMRNYNIRPDHNNEQQQMAMFVIFSQKVITTKI